MQADDPTLQKAVDAYRQARTLDDQLKRSEHAVEKQTKQLRKELKQTKVAAASANTKAFRQEVRMDEDLLNQAESETRRDKRLVRQVIDLWMPRQFANAFAVCELQVCLCSREGQIVQVKGTVETCNR